MNWRNLVGGIESSIIIKPKVGMRVRTITPIDGNNNVINKLGTIKRVSEYDVGVLYDNDINGHNSYSKKLMGHSWCATPEDWNKCSFRIIQD